MKLCEKSKIKLKYSSKYHKTHFYTQYKKNAN